MKNMIWLWLTVFTACYGDVFKSIQPIEDFDAAVRLFQDTPDQMTERVDACLTHYAGIVDAVVAISDDERAYENTVAPIKDMLSDHGDIMILKLINTTLELLLNDETARKAAQMQGLRVKNWYLEAVANDQLYGVLKRYLSALEEQENIKEEEKTALKNLLKKFSCSNEVIDPEVLALNKEINFLERTLAERMGESTPSIGLTAQEMQSIPEAYRNYCKQDEQGRYQITSDWPVYYATDSAVREKVYRFFAEHHYNKNHDAITKIYKAKAALATKQGLQDPAMYEFDRAGLTSIEIVNKDLDCIANMLLARGLPLIDSFVKNQPFSISYQGGKLAPWDLLYMQKIINSFACNNASEVSANNHFSFKETIDGVCAVMGSMLQYSIRLMPHHDNVWHDDVFVIQVSKDEKEIGYIFFDLFGRNGKPDNASYTVRIVSPDKKGTAVFVAVGNQGKRSAFWDHSNLKSMVRKLASTIGQMVLDSPSESTDGFAFGMLAELFGLLMHDELFLRAITKNNPFPVPDFVYQRLSVRPVFNELKTLLNMLYIAYLSQGLLRGQDVDQAWKSIHENQFPCFLYVPKACPFMNSLHLAQFGFTSAMRLIYQEIYMASVYRDWKCRGMLDSTGYIGEFCAVVLKNCKDYGEFQQRMTQFLRKPSYVEDFFINLGI